MSISFDPRTGQYHDDSTRRFVARGDVLSLLNNEIAALKTRLQGHARLAVSGKITTAEFQARFAQTLKEGMLQQAALGAGGMQRLTKSQLGSVGAKLKAQYKRLANFGEALANGELTEKQILARAGQYAESARVAFYDAEKRTRSDIGFNQAKRTLASGVQHCEDCLGYSTNGEWRPVEDVVPPGEGCVCGGNCKCFITYRRYTDTRQLVTAVLKSK